MGRHIRAQGISRSLGAGKSLLITGIDGFVGRHLRVAAEEAGFAVSGFSRSRHSPEEQVYQCDINNEKLLRSCIEVCQPDYVIHLAGMSHFVEGDASSVYQINLLGTRTLLTVLSKAKRPPSRVLLVSSGNVYGISPEDKLGETVPLRPITDYSVSKVAMEFLVPWWNQFFEITVARPFNHIGRGQSASFLVPKLVDTFRKRMPLLELGGMSTIRDYSDVRDTVRVYLELLLHTQVPPHPVNVCTGIGHSSRELVSYLEQITGHFPEIKLNKGLSRAHEIPRLVGDPAFLKRMGIQIPASNLPDCLGWMLSA